MCFGPSAFRTDAGRATSFGWNALEDVLTDLRTPAPARFDGLTQHHRALVGFAAARAGVGARGGLVHASSLPLGENPVLHGALES